MGKAINLEGCRFGRLLVLEQAESRYGKDGKPRRSWRCVCDCGNEVFATTQDLRKGDVQSCGCYHDECTRNRMTIHGDSGNKLHNIWKAMRRRCKDDGHADYRYYGGKGIRVCEEWDKNYSEFKAWAINNGYSDGLTIDRIDVNKDYCPENCRWASMTEQANNRTSNIVISNNGETHTLMEWSMIYSIPYSTLYMRLKSGKSFEEAIKLNKPT